MGYGSESQPKVFLECEQSGFYVCAVLTVVYKLALMYIFRRYDSTACPVKKASCSMGKFMAMMESNKINCYSQKRVSISQNGKKGILHISFHIWCSITVLWIEEDFAEHDTAESKKFCPSLSKLKRILRLPLDQSFTIYLFLDSATPLALEHGEIHGGSKERE